MEGIYEMDNKNNFVSNSITSINTNFFSKIYISVSGMILGILSFLVVLGSIAALIQKDATTFIQALVIAFLISPYGLPKIALWVTAYIEFARDRLKEI